MAISVENRNFSPSRVYLAPPLKGFRLEFGTGARVQKLECWCYRANKKFDDLSRVDTIHERDGRTDGQTPHSCA